MRAQVLLLIAVFSTPAMGQKEVSATPQTDEELPVSEVTLESGILLRGRVVRTTDKSLTLRLESGSEVELSLDVISTVRTNDASTKPRPWFADPNNTRYLLTQSAMPLKAGTGYFSQKELILLVVGYGITDNISIVAGTSPPPLGFWPSAIGMLKLSSPWGEGLHVAGGVEVLVLFAHAAVAMDAFVSMTAGDANAHLTLSAAALALSVRQAGLKFVIAGDYRLAPNFAVVTESWILVGNFEASGGTSQGFATSLALRIFGERLAVEVGAFFIPEDVWVPWLDVTYNFG